jgi:nucleotide-binding universal stress UspA family protein
VRILLAVDGSVSSDRATQLVGSLPLPDDSVVRIVAVQEPRLDVLGLSWVSAGDGGGGRESEGAAEARHLREAIERAERTLERPHMNVEGFLLSGRPGSAIVDEARAMSADVVIVGSRGHGPFATMLLGSTASEIVDHAPCPVLVARTSSLGTIALADDGSPSARTAETLMTRWPIFAGRPVAIVSVTEVGVPVAAGFTPGLYDQVMASYTRAVEEARAERDALARSATERLTDAGLQAEPVVLEGDAAGELVRFVSERGIGTMVLGTRGHTGLARLLLGSVARNVLLHAPCSVLIVRERHGD